MSAKARAATPSSDSAASSSPRALHANPIRTRAHAASYRAPRSIHSFHACRRCGSAPAAPPCPPPSPHRVTAITAVTGVTGGTGARATARRKQDRPHGVLPRRLQRLTAEHAGQPRELVGRRPRGIHVSHREEHLDGSGQLRGALYRLLRLLQEATHARRSGRAVPLRQRQQ